MRSWKKPAVLAAIAAIALGSGPANADPAARPNEWGWMTITSREAFACTSENAMSKFVDLEMSGDKEAALSYASEQIATGVCTGIDRGTQVHIDKSDQHISCVRPRGQTDCLWVVIVQAFGQ
jgi:hypothetical protein